MNNIKLNSNEEFPRKPAEDEKYLLFEILPSHKSGYNYYRNRIEELFIIGYGRFGKSNLIFGKENMKTDISGPSMPVLASGTIKIEDDEIDVTVHEEFEDQIETDISPKHSDQLPGNINVLSKWSYSEWNPGDPAPFDKSYVKEVGILPGKYILAIAPSHRKIWLHETETGINYLIPVSNFFNELMAVKSIRDSRIALKPNKLFSEIANYTDNNFINAFIKYNTYMRRINFDFSQIKIHDEQKPKRKRLNIFGRDKFD